MPRTYAPEEKARGLEIYAERGLAAAHSELGVPKQTLRDWAVAAGMNPADLAGRSVEQTAAATTARTARCEALRVELREQLLVSAADMLDRLGEEHVDYRGQMATQVTFDRAPADACRSYVTSAAILIDKYRLEVGEATSLVATTGDLDRVRSVRDELGKIRLARAS